MIQRQRRWQHEACKRDRPLHRGNIWVFYGACDEEGAYYLLSDDGFLLTVDADPGKSFYEDEDCLFPEWQDAHLLKEINSDSEKSEFSLSVLDILQSYIPDRRKHEDKLGGISEGELAWYRRRFQKIIT